MLKNSYVTQLSSDIPHNLLASRFARSVKSAEEEIKRSTEVTNTSLHFKRSHWIRREIFPRVYTPANI
jgi:hypothetical protein